MVWKLPAPAKKEADIFFIRTLFSAVAIFSLLGGIFPLTAHADDSMPTVISTAISQTFRDARGIFIIQNIGFSASPRVSMTANACITSSGCMSSDNPKFACRANRWVISTNGGMRPVKVPSPYPGAEAIAVQVQEMTNIIRKNLSGSPAMETGTYDAQNGWNNSSLKDTVNVNMGDSVEITAAFSNNVATAIAGAIGKSSGYVDNDGEVCGPGIEEATGNQMQGALSKTQDWVNNISDSIQAKIVWKVPEGIPIQEVQHVIQNYEGITVGGNKVSMPSPAPAQSVLYQQNQANLRTLSEFNTSKSNSNTSVSILAPAKDFYGYALAAQQGTEQANQYIEGRKKENASSVPQSFLHTLKLAFNRLIHFARAEETQIRWLQTGNDLQNSLKIPFAEIDAFSAIRHLAIYNVPIFVGFIGSGFDPELAHAAVILDYNPSNDTFIIFSKKHGLAKISWDALMAGQPRFLVGTPVAKAK